MAQQIINKKIFSERFSSSLAESAENTYTLGKKLSLTPSTISRYANGSMAPEMPTLYSLANIFGVNPLWLMSDDVPIKAEKIFDDEFTRL